MRKRVGPSLRLQREIDEAGPRDLDLGDQIVGAQFRGDRFGEFARLAPASFASTIAALVAMSPWRGIARRLDHDPRQIDARGPSAFSRQRAAHRMHAREHVGEKMRADVGHG